ncbi:FAD assembly factor SdhE [Methylomagnum sp.]
MERGRLWWLCRRGMKELDLPLQGYLEQGYEAASPQERAAFVRLLDESDDSLWRYFFADVSPEDPALAELVRTLRRAAASHP